MKMGVVVNLVDATLLVFFLVIAFAAPLLDSQTLLPHSYFPPFLLHLKSWYTTEYGDYLITDKPHFFVGLVWLELLFQWPLILLNLYAMFAAKPWFTTTILISGVSTITSMVAILSEMVGSKRASDRLLMMYFPFMGFGVLAILRGLLFRSTPSFSAVPKTPALRRKKRV